MTLRARAAAQTAVVFAGPVVVRGPGRVDPDLAEAALAAVDDEWALLGDEVVPVDRVWQHVFSAALGRHRRATVLCPSAWSDARLEMLTRAVRATGARARVRRRREIGPGPWPVVGRGRDRESGRGASVLVELGPDLVLVEDPGGRRAVRRPAWGDPARDAPKEADAVVAAVLGVIGDASVVTLDTGEPADPLARAVARKLRRRGTRVVVRDDVDLVRALSRRWAPSTWLPTALPAGPRPRIAASAAAVVALSLAVAAGWPRPAPAATQPQWVVEGAVALRAPPSWTVRRITTGAGSARLQLEPPGGPGAIHVVQSPLRPGTTLAEVATALGAGQEREPAGVFTGLDAGARRAGRPVITYAELRPHRRVDWTVLIDRFTRIAVGCEGEAAGQCDGVIASVRAVR